MKFIHKYKDLAKVIRVAKSCVSVKHCDTTMIFVSLYVKRYKLSYGNRKLVDSIVEYLIDTREHCERGYHKPSHNDWKTLTAYPDINHYLFDKLEFKV